MLKIITVTRYSNYLLKVLVDIFLFPLQDFDLSPRQGSWNFFMQAAAAIKKCSEYTILIEHTKINDTINKHYN